MPRWRSVEVEGLNPCLTHVIRERRNSFSLRSQLRLTLQLSGRTPPYLKWHFIHHGPLQLLVMSHSLQLVSTYIESTMKYTEDVDVLIVLHEICDSIVAV